MTQLRKTTRGAQTRDRLLSAAVKIFGRDGFHAASTRAIAAESNVNQALIGYHFGGKEGLYLAVFAHIAERLSAEVVPVVERLMIKLPAIDPQSPERVDACVDCIDLVYSALLHLLGETPQARGWVRLVMREQQDPTQAFEILYQRVLSKVLAVLTAIVAKATGADEDSPGCRLRALMIISQVMFILVARSAAMRHMSWADLGTAELQTVKQQALDNIRAQFNGEHMP